MRLPQIDFVKCVCIILMVVMHLQYIGDTYPVAKAMVYTFHMPLFLFLSGWLLRTDRTVRSFMGKYAGVLIPYIIMETGYAVASVFLPVRGGLGELTPLSLLGALVLHPVGPYWYLHTFMLCSAVCFGAVRMSVGRPASEQGESKRSLWVLLVPFVPALLLLWVASRFGIVHLPYALYFWAGAVVRACGVGFGKLFPARLWWMLPAALLFCFPANHRADSVGGVAICYCMMCLLSALHARQPRRLAAVTSSVGQHTLAVLLFSPLFTIVAKLYLPFLLFDPSGMIFMVVSVALAVSGSLGIEWAMRRMGVGRYFGFAKLK